MTRFEIVKGDMIQQKVDMVVAAANQGLRAMSGPDCGDIYAACGTALVEECKALEGCSTGKAKITRSYDLEDKGIPWVVHAVGPRYAGGMYFESDLLADAYEAALQLTLTYKETYKNQCLEVLERYIGHLDVVQKRSYQQNTIDEVRDYLLDYPITSIALPSISTGLYGYPLEEAAPIAIRTIKKFINKYQHLELILLVCHDQTTYNIYRNLV